MRKYINICIILVIVIVSGSIYILKSKEDLEIVSIQQETEIETEFQSFAQETKMTQEETVHKIMVYVCGAVKQSKVVELEEGKRVIDAIELAGGLSEDAEPESINLAAFLYDTQKIYVPKIGEVIDKNDFTGQNNSIEISKIDLNKADKKELMNLNGVGEVTAKAIIEYREKNGPFKSIEEIKNVSGIGEKSFEKIKDYIKI